MDQQELDGPSLNRLHDLAKAEAERLLRQAMRDFGSEVVDDFWRGANALWQRGQTTAQRSAARLRARLARRPLARGRARGAAAHRLPGDQPHPAA